MKGCQQGEGGIIRPGCAATLATNHHVQYDGDGPGTNRTTEVAMTHDDAFLQGIIESPDDDAPRLVYADWLDEHGQPERAEFIRAQIDLAGRPPRDPRRPPLEKRQRALLRKHGARWFLAPPPTTPWQLGANPTLARGFPDSYGCGARALLQGGAELFARWPLTRLWLGIDDAPELVGALARAPFLSRLRQLNLYCPLAGPGPLAPLFASRHLASLVRLVGERNARGEGWGDVGVRLLARSPHLAGLRELYLSHAGLTGAGLRALARSQYRRAMRFLGLTGNRLGAEDVAALLTAGGWPALTGLELWNTGLGDEGVEPLAACRGLARLTFLNLNHNGLTDRAARALAGSPHAANLRVLSLAYNSLSSGCAGALIGSPHLHGLAALNLSRCPGIAARARRALREHFGERVTFAGAWDNTPPVRYGAAQA
jgi:uncharacterized protein (TIGR02996 family)